MSQRSMSLDMIDECTWLSNRKHCVTVVYIEEALTLIGRLILAYARLPYAARTYTN
jgi:hypothetical protein